MSDRVESIMSALLGAFIGMVVFSLIVIVRQPQHTRATECDRLFALAHTSSDTLNITLHDRTCLDQLYKSKD